MATKFYLSADRAPNVTPPAPTDWGHAGLHIYRRMQVTKQGSVTTTLTTQYDGSDDTTDLDAIFAGFVSPPIQASSVSGTISANRIRAQIRVRESTANNELKLSGKFYLIDSTGAFKALLLALTREATEFVVSPTATTNRLFNRVMGGTVSVSDYDRIVGELGWGGQPVAGAGVNGHNGAFTLGEDAGTDLTQGNETETVGDPWISFGTDTFTFMPELAPIFQRHRSTKHILAR